MKTRKIILIVLSFALLFSCKDETTPVDVDVAQEIERKWECERQSTGMTYSVTITKTSEDTIKIKNFNNLGSDAVATAKVYADNTIELTRQEMLNTIIGGTAVISEEFQQIDWTYYVVQDDSINYNEVFTIGEITKLLR